MQEPITPWAGFIQDAINARNESLAVFGQAMGVDRSTVVSWLQEARRPYQRNVRRVAEVLGKPVDELLELAGHGSLPREWTVGLGKPVGDAYVRQTTSAERLALVRRIAELEQAFAAAAPVLAARQVIEETAVPVA